MPPKHTPPEQIHLPLLQAHFRIGKDCLSPVQHEMSLEEKGRFQGEMSLKVETLFMMVTYGD